MVHIDCTFSAAASRHCHTSVQPICVLTPCPCRAGTYDNQIRKWIKDDVGADVTAEDADMTELGKRLISKCAPADAASFSISHVTLPQGVCELCKTHIPAAETCSSCSAFTCRTPPAVRAVPAARVATLGSRGGARAFQWPRGCRHAHALLVSPTPLLLTPLLSASSSPLTRRKGLPTFSTGHLNLEALLAEGRRLHMKRMTVRSLRHLPRRQTA